MSFVIDASATLPWRFEDEATPWTEALLDRVLRGEEVLVPSHRPLEVANGLFIALRRGRVTSGQIQEFGDDLAAFPLKLQPPSNPNQWPGILALSQQYRLTVYDAAYLELAKRSALPTLDGDLRSATKSEGVVLL